MELVVEKGRPADESGRLEKEIRSYDLLEQLGIEFDRVDHEPQASIEGCAAVDKVFQVNMCKNLFLCNRQETQFYLLMMPGDKRFVTKDLSAQLGVARLSFAKDTYMEEFLDITPGSVSVLGLANDTENRVRLLIDEDVIKDSYVACHPCINTSSLKISTADLMGKILPAIHHQATIVHLN